MRGSYILSVRALQHVVGITASLTPTQHAINRQGFRTITASVVDANYLTIRGRNSGRGSDPTFAVHGTLERGGQTLVNSFSGTGRGIRSCS